MLFTVIIPTCNRNDLLANCLDLITAGKQSFDAANYEVLVSDDSIDNRAEGLINDKFPFIKWLEGPKNGPAANRNNGAKQAQGKWLVFLDDDFLPDAGLLEKYSLLITQNSKIKVFEGGIEREGRMKSPFTKLPETPTPPEDFYKLQLCN